MRNVFLSTMQRRVSKRVINFATIRYSYLSFITFRRRWYIQDSNCNQNSCSFCKIQLSIRLMWTSKKKRESLILFNADFTWVPQNYGGSTSIIIIIIIISSSSSSSSSSSICHNDKG